ncbi:MAG TPA: PhzF family phenazine biosynthesis protein, partial [Terriglobales bacterium]|nr:PhzF family phenazine biosynthesis protein [Terriglobales bacterium]
VQVRIFTVGEELPFAGHPTLGTAFVLRGAIGAGEVTLDLKVGKIPVRFEAGNGQPVFGEMRQRDPELGEVHDREAVAAAAGLRPDQIADDVPIQTVSTGVAFVIVPLRSLATMRNMRVDLQRAAEYLQRGEGKFFYFVCREKVDPSARLHARMFFYNGEDPATGSAAGCAAAWMAAYGVAQPGERVLIEQGVEMGRPSRIFVRADKDGNRVVNVRVGGNAVEVLRGEVVL